MPTKACSDLTGSSGIDVRSFSGYVSSTSLSSTRRGGASSDELL